MKLEITSEGNLIAKKIVRITKARGKARIFFCQETISENNFRGKRKTVKKMIKIF